MPVTVIASSRAAAIHEVMDHRAAPAHCKACADNDEFDEL